MRQALAILALLISATAVMGQETKDPVTAVVKEILSRQQKNLTAAVEEMPADKFGYKPTPQQMSFGHLVLHIIESNNHFCSKIGDVAPPAQAELKDTDGKDKLVAALKSSFEFCTTALAKLNDAKLSDTVDLGSRKTSRAHPLIALTNDWADHYGAAAMYLRLNGLLPPTAKPKK